MSKAKEILEHLKANDRKLFGEKYKISGSINHFEFDGEDSVRTSINWTDRENGVFHAYSLSIDADPFTPALKHLGTNYTLSVGYPKAKSAKAVVLSSKLQELLLKAEFDFDVDTSTVFWRYLPPFEN